MLRTPKNQSITFSNNLNSSMSSSLVSSGRVKKTSQHHDFGKMSEVMNYLHNQGMIKDSIDIFLEYMLSKQTSRADELFDRLNGVTQALMLYPWSSRALNYFLNSITKDQDTFTSESDTILSIINFQFKSIMYLEQNLNNSTNTDISILEKKISLLNNMGIYSLKSEEYGSCLEHFRTARKLMDAVPEEGDSQMMSCQINNNYGLMLLIIGDLEMAQEVIRKSVSQAESKIFPKIQGPTSQFLVNDRDFIAQLPILIYGYLYCEIAFRKDQFATKSPIETNIKNLNFLKNAYSLSLQFLGPEHEMTQIVIAYQNQFKLESFEGDDYHPFEINKQKITNLQINTLIKRGLIIPTFPTNQSNENIQDKQVTNNFNMPSAPQNQRQLQSNNNVNNAIYINEDNEDSTGNYYTKSIVEPFQKTNEFKRKKEMFINNADEMIDSEQDLNEQYKSHSTQNAVQPEHRRFASDSNPSTPNSGSIKSNNMAYTSNPSSLYMNGASQQDNFSHQQQQYTGISNNIESYSKERPRSHIRNLSSNNNNHEGNLVTASGGANSGSSSNGSQKKEFLIRQNSGNNKISFKNTNSQSSLKKAIDTGSGGRGVGGINDSQDLGNSSGIYGSMKSDEISSSPNFRNKSNNNSVRTMASKEQRNLIRGTSSVSSTNTIYNNYNGNKNNSSMGGAEQKSMISEIENELNNENNNLDEFKEAVETLKEQIQNLKTLQLQIMESDMKKSSKEDNVSNLQINENERTKQIKEVDEKLQVLESGVSNLKSMNEQLIKQSKSQEADVDELKKMISRLLEGQQELEKQLLEQISQAQPQIAPPVVNNKEQIQSEQINFFEEKPSSNPVSSSNQPIVKVNGVNAPANSFSGISSLALSKVASQQSVNIEKQDQKVSGSNPPPSFGAALSAFSNAQKPVSQNFETPSNATSSIAAAFKSAGKGTPDAVNRQNSQKSNLSNNYYTSSSINMAAVHTTATTHNVTNNTQASNSERSLLYNLEEKPILKVLSTIVDKMPSQSSFFIQRKIYIKDQEIDFQYGLTRQGGHSSVSMRAYIKDQIIKEEIIQMEKFQILLNHFQFEDVLPVSLPYYAVTSPESFCNYLLLPFSVLVQKDESYQIRMYQQAPGILDQVIKRKFLNQPQCLVNLHYIQGNTFRVIVIGGGSGKGDGNGGDGQRASNTEQLSFDLEFDNSTLNLFFKITDTEKLREERLDTLLNFSEITDEKTEGKELTHRKIDLKKIAEFAKTQDLKNRQYTTTSFKVQNLEKFLGYLDQIFDNLQAFLIGKGFSKVSELDSSSNQILTTNSPAKLLYIKSLNESKKGTIFLAEQRPTEQTIEVSLQNIHETFGPGGSKIKVSGKYEVPLEDTQQRYGLIFENLCPEEKKLMLFYTMQGFNLSVHDRCDEGLMRPGAKLQENPISRLPFVSGGFVRELISVGQRKFPITFQEVGIKEKLQGIQVSLYNPNNKQQEGAFFSCCEKDWFFSNEEVRKKAHKIFIDTLPLSNYVLTLFFQHLAVQLIQNEVEIGDIMGTPVIKNIRSNIEVEGKISRIQNIISINALLSVDEGSGQIPFN